MYKRFSTVASAVLLFWCGSGLIWADLAPMRSVGRTIQPLEDTSVRMVSEKVEISLNEYMAFVSCRFDMRNEGSAKKLLTGFPRGKEGELLDFRAWVNQKEIPVTSGGQWPKSMGGNQLFQAWKTFSVPFDASGKMVTIINSYRTLLLPDEKGEELMFTYILETGAFWKDTIGEATIIVDFGTLPSSRITHLSPAGYTKKGNIVTWNFKNFEPKENIKIRFIKNNLIITPNQ